MSDRLKIIVLDDDPMGAQTVHSCLLLIQWDVQTLLTGLQDSIDIFFILTNTRALTPENAATRTREVCQNLKEAISQAGTVNFLLVSRGDSTLRGHYPIETDVITEIFGDFDAHFFMPAFFEAGRITENSTHYLRQNGVVKPLHETEFAKDSVFAYKNSFLPDYVAEKTKGRISAADVEQFTLDHIRNRRSLQRLIELGDNRCCIVDGENQSDFDLFAIDLLAAVNEGKRFLLRSAASILTSLAGLGLQPISEKEMQSETRKHRPGVIVVGSYVAQTTLQLEELWTVEGIVGVEVSVQRLHNETPEPLVAEILEQVEAIFESGKTAVVYTSRQESQFQNIQTRQEFGAKVSGTLMEVVRQLPSDIGFLISKGGITSNAVLTNGLGLESARLLGQIHPGCSVVQTAYNHPRYPLLPVVLFPGNVGDEFGLKIVYQRLTSLR